MSSDKLGEMYATAIKMNAENKINATNTWSLQLIENMDKIIAPPPPPTSSSGGGSGGFSLGNGGGSSSSSSSSSGGSSGGHVAAGFASDGQPAFSSYNFQKASCTLDASIKIYSYRVDDVHLSSYKVLANLNRTDGGQGASGEDGTAEEAGNDGKEKKKRAAATERRATAVTLEHDKDKINMSKLDAAFDIDPLFHKMSKTFDEGGAKGMLLANLSCGTDGCGIVFDSKEDSSSSNNNNAAAAAAASQQPGAAAAAAPLLLSISSLTSKLLSLGGVESLNLVPQLAGLREQHDALKSGGYLTLPNASAGGGGAPRSKRYANDDEEEAKAEREVVKEHMERSAANTPVKPKEMGLSVTPEGGGNAGGDDDDDDDDAFDGFMAANDDDDGFGDGGGGSFDCDSSSVGLDGDGGGGGSSRGAVSSLIDAIANQRSSSSRNSEGAANGGGRSSPSTSEDAYSYYNLADVLSAAGAKGGNNWAGASHWKRGAAKGAAAVVGGPPPADGEADDADFEGDGGATATTKRGKKVATYLDLSSAVDESVFGSVSGKGAKSRVGFLMQTAAAIAKQAKCMNLLPHDSGVGVAQLSRLFLRPNAAVRTGGGGAAAASSSSASGEGESGPVGFEDVERDGDLGFEGADDDGFAPMDESTVVGARDFLDGDNYVKELKGVRKVEKVEVGYATVAKKVDVKRLKHDLWEELSAKLNVADPSAPKTPVSFGKTVDVLEATQAQDDVSTAYYFICVLHLANEMGLRLEGQDNLLDFKITSDDGKTPEPVSDASAAAAAAAAPREKTKRVAKAKVVVAANDIDDDDDDDVVPDDDEEDFE